MTENTSSELLGQRIGHIRVVSILGEGGMGTVYAGYDDTLQRQVALKAIRRDHRLKSTTKARFLREARILSQLDHPNICTVHDFVTDKDSDTDILVLELIKGKSLRQMIDEGFERGQQLEIARQLLDVLAAVHGKGVIHRDLKPENVMITRDGDVKVLDFGLARSIEEEALLRSDLSAMATAALVDGPQGQPLQTTVSKGSVYVKTKLGTILGTISYMSPEQARGEPATSASDIYSLGLILQEVFTGSPPFQRDLEPMTLLMKAANADTRPVTGLDPELIHLINRLKSAAPGARPSAADAAQMLAHLIDRPRRRRRRLLAAVLALLVITAVSIPLGLWLAERSRARRLAAVSERLAHQVRDVEWGIRVARLLPLHDIRHAKEQLQQRIGTIAAELDDLQDLATGPGNAALGRAHLALHQLGPARTHLERAWQAGYRTPETALALGMTLAYLYQDELEELGKIRSRSLREARRKQLQAEYREQTISYLAASNQEEASFGAYVEAQIAFNEGRFDDAIIKARAAALRDAGLFEAHLLEGMAHRELGELQRTGGTHEQAMAAYAEAEQAYRTAVHVARSDARGYLRLCELYQLMMAAGMHSRGGDMAELRQEAVDACSTAISADSSSPAAYSKLAEVHRLWATQEVHHGRDPSPALRLAEEAAHRALNLDQDHVASHNTLGLLYTLRADFLAGQGAEATPVYETAIEHLQRCCELAPSDPRPFNNLGFVHLSMTEVQQASGQDPEPALVAAIGALQEAIRLVPEYVYGYNNLGNAYQFRADVQARRGEDPRPALHEAAAVLRRALELKPDHVTAHNNLGFGSIAEATWELEHGRDPSHLLDQAAEALAEALQINPSYVTPHFNLGLLHQLRARIDIVQDRDPTASLARSAEAFATGIDANPGIADVFTSLTETHLLAAGYWLDRQQSPNEALRLLRSSCNRALHLNPSHAEALRLMGEAELTAARWAQRTGAPSRRQLQRAEEYLQRAWDIDRRELKTALALARVAAARAELALVQGNDPSTEVETGLQWVTEGTSINPAHAELLAIAGTLHLLAADGVGSVQAQASHAGEAEVLLGRALELNPLLAGKLSAKLERARRLADRLEQ